MIRSRELYLERVISSLLSFHAISILILLVTFAGCTAIILRTAPSLASKEFEEIANARPVMIWCERANKLIWFNKFHEEMSKKYGIESLTLADFVLQSPIKLDGTLVQGTLENAKTKEITELDLSTLVFQGTTYYMGQCKSSPAGDHLEGQRFVKNVTETFGNAPVGVAMFDKTRGLSMFNPALSNLLELSPTWLAGAPSMKEFLNRLHDKGALPEPRDFNAWRDDLIAMDFEKSGSHYRDDWNMPNGNVFTVSAYPHKDGSITLYAEDITGRLLVEQEFRNHLDALYAAFDAIDDPIALFDPSGELSFANTAFDTVWGEPFSQSIILPSILSISKVWVELCVPSPAFGDLREFIFQLGEKERWTSNIELKSGQRFELVVTPLAHGQTLCEFRHVSRSIEFAKPKMRRTRGKLQKV